MRLLVLFLLLLPATAAFDTSLYDASQVTANVTVTSSVQLEGIGSGETLEATVYYVPEESDSIDAAPQPANTQPLTFIWEDVRAGHYPFSYTTTVTTHALSPRITSRVPYPFSSPSELTVYLQAHEITDTNKAIQAKAHELANGKSDALEVVFAIATWVDKTVQYNLTTATEQASKPSSWVYEQRYGVCDEITSLFISLSREAGIPARFVSGIAYTNLSQFDDNWGPHGWAEVWLPQVGWIPVDVTYRQIDYLDATHIPIRHSTDARNTAIDYSLRARNLQMSTTQLQTHTVITDFGGSVTQPISVSAEPLYEEAGSRSGNVITATVKNNAPYYLITTLYLSTTHDTLVHEKMYQHVLLPPKSSREVSWRVTMPEFDEGYTYTVPFAIKTERAGSTGTTVRGSARSTIYPLPPAPAVTVSSVPIDCEQPPVLYVGETATSTCASKGAKLCATECSPDEITLSFEATEPGAYPYTVRATSSQGQGSAIVTFIVDEKPQPTISATMPQTVGTGDTPTLQVQVHTAKLTSAIVRVEGEYLEHEWEVGELEQKNFELRFPATYLVAGENDITITVRGNDKNNELVEASTTVPVTLEASGWDKFELFWLHLFL